MAEIKQIKIGSTTYDIEPYTSYLPSSGGKLTGLLTLMSGNGGYGLKFRDHANYQVGLYYGTGGDEALTLAMQNQYTAFQIINSQSPSELGGSSWQGLQPGFQVKGNKVAINKIIGEDAFPSYDLDVNGSICGTTIYENEISLSNKYAAKSYVDSYVDSSIAAIIDSESTYKTFKLVADYIAKDKEGAADMMSHITANATAIANEKIRAEGVEAGLADDINAISTTVSAHETAIKNSQTDIDTLEGYFTDGVANSAAKLTTTSKKAWGRTFWTSGGIPQNVTGNMTDVGSISMSDALTLTGGTAATSKISFSREGYNYITFPEAGNLGLGTSAAGAGIVAALSKDALFPYNDGKTLGTSSKKWSNVYATTFTGNLSGTADSANWLNTNTALTYGASGLNYFNINGTAGNTKANNTPTSAWYHILRMNHGNAGGYLADIAVPLNDVDGVYWRQIRNGSFYGWYKFLDSNNYTSYALALDGTNTMTGKLNLLASGANDTNIGSNGIRWNASSLPQDKAPKFVCTIDAFDQGGRQNWAQISDLATSVAPYLISGTAGRIPKFNTANTIVDGWQIRNNSTEHLEWTSQTTDAGFIPTINKLAYWTGRYNSTSSNLTYCVRGYMVGTDNTSCTANAIPRYDSTSARKIKTTGITIDDSNNISIPGKITQGSPSSDSTITSMNRFASDLFISGDGSAPNSPKVAGFYLGKSAGSDENRHMDIVSGSDYSYIDFNKASVVNDYQARLLVNVTTGHTEWCWNAGTKTFSFTGGTVSASTFSAPTVSATTVTATDVNSTNSTYTNLTATNATCTNLTASAPIKFTTEANSKRIIYGSTRSSGMKYDYGGNEALIISAGTYAQSSIHFYTSGRLTMNDSSNQWSGTTPCMAIKNKCVAINGYFSDTPSHNLYVTGTAYFTNSITASSVYATSDERLKENITTAELNYYDFINNVHLVNYTWKDDENHSLQHGVIAQELQNIIPDELKDHFILTDKANDNMLAVNDGKLIYIALGALQQQTKINAQLEERISKLEQLLGV